MAILRPALLSASVAFGLLAGCASTPAPAPAQRPLPPVSAASAASINGPLAAEWRRLAELFRGTPVVFTRLADGNLQVDVPLRYSFDTGAALVKPPLAAVLDRVANSQREQATRLVVSAPTDLGASGLALASTRAVGIRDHLAGKGVAASRVAIAAAARGDVKVLVVVGAGAPH